MSKELLQNLINRKILNEFGKKVGQVLDLIIDKKSGKIQAVVAKVDKSEEILQKLTRDEKGNTYIPFSVISMIKNDFQIDEKKLRLIILKKKTAWQES
ncbi:MAG: PRC-barrel domain-containing protein [Candidatus Freyarchaeota archaeon]|nr:PRC-barrel domain-containing protein [Candidatus Jordarchaeia archaeon]MBS7267327.1 PRC-barrel domain-containing protein [Candidatus Jordarchaeia archaeon]MBS7281057.1 PRC-barrel domain-containing protein [Candidatus Jordarchaeia archaeon]